MVKYRKAVSLKSDEGYDYENADWYKSCLKGDYRLPPDQDMGKTWVEDFFPYHDTLKTWFWDAGDVTHVSADMTPYDDIRSYMSRPKYDHNEMLYALKCAPLLSGKYKPSEMYRMMADGVDHWPRIVEVVGKSENTKAKGRVRETWSADDCTRELTSAYDRAAIPINSLFLGSTSRTPDWQVQNIFNRICRFTDPASSKVAVITSTDISGWSTTGDRSAWAMHHDYVSKLTKRPDCLTMDRIWRGITGCLAKRGMLSKFAINRGLFQGFTGTLDTMLNLHLALYTVRLDRRAGVVLTGEGATTAALIDDAIQAIEIDMSRGTEHAQHIADVHRATTSTCYSLAGAEISDSKTQYSTSKFQFLNRIFCEGCEIHVPLKVFARANRELNRRFASVFSQIDTVFGSFRSAVVKGACVYVSYYSAILRSLELIHMTNPVVDTWSLDLLVNATGLP